MRSNSNNNARGRFGSSQRGFSKGGFSNADILITHKLLKVVVVVVVVVEVVVVVVVEEVVIVVVLSLAQ